MTVVYSIWAFVIFELSALLTGGFTDKLLIVLNAPFILRINHSLAFSNPNSYLNPMKKSPYITIGAFLTSLLLGFLPAQANDEIEQLFRSENIEGTFVVASVKSDLQETFNAKRAEIQYSPASTYKVLNTLIGLKTGAVSSADFSFKWDGVDRGIAVWNQDHSLASAFKVSCVWCYQVIANQVGVSSYSAELEAVSYGNQSVSDPVDLHWLNGDLKVSANEQIEFLQQLVNGTLPYEQRHIDSLKEIMLVERRSNYTLYAKTGWAGPELAVGWYVGYIETKDDTFVFAMNMRMSNAKQGPLRKKLVIQSLRALNLI